MSAGPGSEPLVRFEGVRKRFGEVAAVDGVDLELREGEFFALLGPSGCGKTTLMRLLAGFEAPDTGRIRLAGEDLAGVPPHRRAVNMMFQSYALFPHLSVFENIAFGLRRDRLAKAEVASRVGELVAMVRLEGLERRMPSQLSGGQRQRVALARALARRPQVLLLDEPMAALDRRLREETQFELKALQTRIGATFLVVTHDQDEAMMLADRMAVMEAGRIVQVGTPAEIYEAPKSRAVASFVGEANLFETLAGADGTIRDEALDVSFRVEGAVTAGETVWLAVRPERMAIGRTAPKGAANLVAGTLVGLGYTGDWTTFLVETDSGRRLRAASANTGRSADPLAAGDRVFLTFAPEAAVVLRR